MRPQPRTVKRLSVSEHFIADTFVGWNQRDYVSLPVIVGVPHDAVVERSGHDAWRGVYSFVLSHPSFAEVKPGEEIPSIDGDMEVRSFKVAWVDNGSQATIEVPVNVACLKAENNGVRKRVWQLEDENAALKKRVAELQTNQSVTANREIKTSDEEIFRQLNQLAEVMVTGYVYEFQNQRRAQNSGRLCWSMKEMLFRMVLALTKQLQEVRDMLCKQIDKKPMVITYDPSSEPKAQRLGAEQMRERCAKVAEGLYPRPIAPDAHWCRDLPKDYCDPGKHVAAHIRELPLPITDKTIHTVKDEDGNLLGEVSLRCKEQAGKAERGMLFVTEEAKVVPKEVWDATEQMFKSLPTTMVENLYAPMDSANKVDVKDIRKAYGYPPPTCDDAVSDEPSPDMKKCLQKAYDSIMADVNSIIEPQTKQTVDDCDEPAYVDRQ